MDVLRLTRAPRSWAPQSADRDTIEALVRLRAEIAAERDALRERTRRLGDLEAEVVALLARWGRA